MDRYQEATKDLQQSAALFRATGDWTGGAYTLSNLGLIDLRQGHQPVATQQDWRYSGLLALRSSPAGPASARRG